MAEQDNLQGKKLLILGGSDLHCELVRTAKKLGVETYVTDYRSMEQSPGKQLADHAWDLSTTDIDAVVERCRREGIDGVLNMYYDSCQLPYQEICEKLGLPCFGTREQYEIFTDKQRFLETCVKYGVDIIPQYREEDFAFDNPEIEYPVYVKPSDCCGSRGQSVCRSYAEVGPAIALARKESSAGNVVIERFIENGLDIQLVILMIDGEPYPEHISHKFNGTAEEGFSGMILGGVAPTRHEKTILADGYPKIEKMLKALELRNAPVFLQAFLDGDKLRVYDPALRFPGALYEQGLREATGLDVFEAMVVFALTGAFPQWMKTLPTCRKMDGMSLALLFINLRSGTIREIRGLEELGKEFLVTVKHSVGDRIEAWYDVRQCFCEMDFLFHSMEEAERIVQRIYNTLQILDENGEDMKIALLDTAQLQG